MNFQTPRQSEGSLTRSSLIPSQVSENTAGGKTFQRGPQTERRAGRNGGRPGVPDPHPPTARNGVRAVGVRASAARKDWGPGPRRAHRPEAGPGPRAPAAPQSRPRPWLTPSPSQRTRGDDGPTTCCARLQPSASGSPAPGGAGGGPRLASVRWGKGAGGGGAAPGRWSAGRAPHLAAALSA